MIEAWWTELWGPTWGPTAAKLTVVFVVWFAGIVGLKVVENIRWRRP